MIHRRGLAAFLTVSAVLTGVIWSWSAGAPRPPRAFEPPPGVLSLSAGDAAGPAFSSGINDTFYFGGTRWAPDSSRWEAIPDSVWTFESGVGSHYQHPPGSCKDSGFHELMEGWVGATPAAGTAARFRRLGTSAFSGTPCVGAAGGLGGNYSFWAGLLQAEADSLCWAAGQGYGDYWTVCIVREIAYDDAGCLHLDYRYHADLEPGFDYVYVVIDTTGALPATDGVDVASYTGQASGTESLTLAAGTDLPSQAGPILVKFCVVSDGAYSDEDGNYATSCGAFGVDDIRIWNTNCGGAIDDLSSFETGTDGWVAGGPCPSGSDLSRIVSVTDLPWPPGYTGGCDLGDSVLAFYDPATGGHPLYQDNIALSPWIDLRRAGKVGFARKVLELGGYYELPLLNYIFVQTLGQWYPDTCSVTGVPQASPLTHTANVYFGGVPTCASVVPRRIDLSTVIPPSAEEARVAVGVINYCRYYGNCTQITNSTPWFDNIRFGVATGNTIQSLVDAAAPGDTVIVGAGTFTGAGFRDITFRGKEIVLLAPAGPESTVIDCQGAARGFIIDSGEDSTLVIDGFTVRNGKAPATSEWPYLQNGGGVLITGKARPTLRGCIIEAAQAGSGGGIYVADSSGAIVETTMLRGDTASFGGGGLSGNRYADVRIESCTVESNQAYIGGGIYGWDSAVDVFSSTIQGNTAIAYGDGEGGGVYGGGLLRSCLIRRNRASYGGGTCGSSRLEDCEISENVAGEGGGAAAMSSASGCRFIGNVATGSWGGGGADIPSYATISDCLFAGNKGRIGGGCYVYVPSPNSPARLHLEAMPTRESIRPNSLVPASSELTPWLVGCTFVGNSAEYGGAMALDSRAAIASKCIFWGNCADSSGDQTYVLGGGTGASFHCCAVDTSGHAFNGPVVYDGPQVFTDPRFCSPASCFATPTTAGDYHLAAGSPCLPESSPCDSLIGALGMGCSTTGVPDDRPPLPLTASLRAYPNPFRADVTFVVGVPANAIGTIEIFDVRGRRVRSFEAQAGETALGWDGRSEQGARLPQGIYFVRLHAGAEFKTQRVILIR